MNKSIMPILAFVLLVVSSGGCATAIPLPTPVLPTFTPLPTNTPIPPTATPTPPTAMPSPTVTAILASNAPITVGNLSISLSRVEFMDVGFNPCGSGPNTALVVSVSEDTAKLGAKVLAGLNVWFTDEQGNKLGTCQPTMSGTNYKGAQTFDWYVYLAEPANKYFMHFPTGEVIDLSHLLP